MTVGREAAQVFARMLLTKKRFLETNRRAVSKRGKEIRQAAARGQRERLTVFNQAKREAAQRASLRVQLETALRLPVSGPSHLNLTRNLKNQSEPGPLAVSSCPGRVPAQTESSSLADSDGTAMGHGVMAAARIVMGEDEMDGAGARAAGMLAELPRHLLSQTPSV
eukprot:1560046-Rhodomonas_salina.1